MVRTSALPNLTCTMRYRVVWLGFATDSVSIRSSIPLTLFIWYSNSPLCFGNLLTTTYAPFDKSKPTERAGNNRSPILNLCLLITVKHQDSFA
jgi:hypothetical protein